MRELRNALQDAFVIGEGAVLHESDLPPEVTGAVVEGGARTVNSPGSRDRSEPVEVRRIRMALERASGNRERAAQILGMSRVTLWRTMKHVGLLANEDEVDADTSQRNGLPVQRPETADASFQPAALRLPAPNSLKR